MAEFQPSAASLTPRQRALASLHYAKKAVTALEKSISAGDHEVPTWVTTQIGQAAASLGHALSFVNQQKTRSRNRRTKR